jgi:SAM-dependent methyltransferase
MKSAPTTERIVMEDIRPHDDTYVIHRLHLATYKQSMPHVVGKRVLDYGCGTGYGTAFIKDACSSVIGIDVSREAIDYATAHYAAPNLAYLRGDPVERAPLPFPEDCFDVVLSFQVIEHVSNTRSYLEEIRRVLAPGGTVMISTPDRASRLLPFQKPWNMWHLREYSGNMLHAEISRLFEDVHVQRVGGRPEVIGTELRRTRKWKWLLLPLTLPVTPEWLRISGLRLIKNLRHTLAVTRSGSSIPSFDDSGFRFSDTENPSIGLVATARKPPSIQGASR